MAELLVNVDVADLERAVAFYTRAFELRVGRRLGTFAVELLGAPSPLYLLCKEAGTAAFHSAAETRRYERHWTPVHLDWVVSDIEAAVARVVAAGARPESEISEAAWGKLASFADPFGHGFCLLEWSSVGYDALVT